MKDILELDSNDKEYVQQLLAIKRLAKKCDEHFEKTNVEGSRLSYAYLCSSATFELICDHLPEYLEIAEEVDEQNPAQVDSVLFSNQTASVNGFRARMGNQDDERTWNEFTVTENTKGHFYMQEPCELVLTQLHMEQVSERQQIKLIKDEHRLLSTENKIVFATSTLLGASIFGKSLFNADGSLLNRIITDKDLLYTYKDNDDETRHARVFCLPTDEMTIAIMNNKANANMEVEKEEVFNDFVVCSSFDNFISKIAQFDPIIKTMQGEKEEIILKGNMAQASEEGKDSAGAISSAKHKRTLSRATSAYESESNGKALKERNSTDLLNVRKKEHAAKELDISASTTNLDLHKETQQVPMMNSQPTALEQLFVSEPEAEQDASTNQSANELQISDSVEAETEQRLSMKELRKRNKEILQNHPPPVEQQTTISFLPCLFDEHKLREYAQENELKDLNIPEFLRILPKMQFKEVRYLPPELPEALRVYYVRYRNIILQNIEEINRILKIFQVLLHFCYFKCGDKTWAVAHYLSQQFQGLGLPRYEPGCVTGEQEESDDEYYHIMFAAELIVDQDARNLAKSILKAL